jgi:hypothetical protein
MNDPHQPGSEPLRASTPRFVDASHITPWQREPNARLNPDAVNTEAANRDSAEARRASLRAARDAIRPYPAAGRPDNGQGTADQQRSAFAPGAARRGRKPKAPPSIFREAARALIKPKPGPKAGDKIEFEADDTPADAERVLDRSSTPISPAKSGPLPRTAPADAQQRRDKVRDVRIAITPLNDVKRTADAAASAASSEVPSSSPQLSDAEMEQVITWTVERYGAILNIEQAAEVSKLAKQTIRQRVCEGRYADSVVRGRPLRFWTHRFLRAAMEENAS